MIYTLKQNENHARSRNRQQLGCREEAFFWVWLRVDLDCFTLYMTEESVHPTESNIQATWMDTSRFLDLARGHKLGDCVFFMFTLLCISDLYQRLDA